MCSSWPQDVRWARGQAQLLLDKAVGGALFTWKRFLRDKGAAMLHEVIPFLPPTDWAYADELLSDEIRNSQRIPKSSGLEPEEFLDQLPEMPRGAAREPKESHEVFDKKKEEAGQTTGHALFQESFFFCTVKNVGDIPGAGCIYVEAAVEPISGVAFAKVYSAKSPLNAVDFLRSRVVPFFERRGNVIGEIYTRRTTEYCGPVTTHAFESFLAGSHIRHLHVDHCSRPYNYICEQFYRLLLKEFFLPALRTRFDLTLVELQRKLDAFVQSHNSTQLERAAGELRLHPFAINFPIHL